ncbi:ABC transporter permease [Ferrimonas marina]|uniref:ABC-2 type transport system permease protein n=1 Tax=Ferrimonas marina TaxID=299255 RepID=A0A1M5Y1F6_9GAMM|nr:ABC transporter permease [Ferrimonas marina]SHI05796.1 ABC-2 type transport system permease protein [Ferrimonas marina]
MTVSWRALWREQAQALLKDTPVLLTFVAGLLLYVVLYPLPYLHQVATEQPVILLDHDQSDASRRLVRALQATPGIRIDATATELPQALRQVRAGERKGLVLIPADFGWDLRRGGSATVVVAADGNYFLAYGAIAESVVRAGMVLGGEVRLARQVLLGDGQALLKAERGGVGLNLVPASNLKMGYLDYVLPGLFVLILHQLMLICVGISTVRQRRTPGLWQQARLWQLLTVQASLMIPPFVLAGCWYLGPALRGYGVTLLGSAGETALLLLPFFLATFALGTVLGHLFLHRDSLSQALVLSSMPLLFSAGFVWPVESLPLAWTALWGLVPSQPMIQGMLQLNQMGAPMAALQPLWGILWALVLGWGGLAALLWQRSLRLNRPVGREAA